MLHPDGVQVAVRVVGSQQPYAEWSRSAFASLSQRGINYRSIAVRHGDFYEVVLKFEHSFVLGEQANSPMETRFANSEVDSLKIDIQIDNSVATKECFIKRAQLWDLKEHVISSFRCNSDSRYGFKEAPVKVYCHLKLQDADKKRIHSPQPKAAGQAGMIAVTLTPGKIKNVAPPRQWPPMLSLHDALNDANVTGGVEACTRPVYEAGIVHSGMIFESFEAQRTSDIPQYQFMFECALPDTLAETHQPRTNSPIIISTPAIESIPSQPNHVVRPSGSILTNAQRNFLLDILQGINDMATFQNALRSSQQQRLECPMKLGDMQDALHSNRYLSISNLTGSLLCGIYWFEENGYFMTAKDLKTFIVQETRKWSEDDELQRGFRYMLEFPDKKTAVEMAKRPPTALPVSYSTKADAAAKGIMSPTSPAKRRNPAPQTSSKKRWALGHRTCQLRDAVQIVLPPVDVAPDRSESRQIIQSTSSQLTLPAPTKPGNYGSDKFTSIAPLKASRSVQHAFMAKSPLLQLSSVTHDDEPMSTTPIQTILSKNQNLNPIPESKSPESKTSPELREMNDQELELELRIKNNVLVLHTRRGANEADIFQLHISRVEFEIEKERRRMLETECIDDTDTFISLKIELSEFKARLQKLQAKTNGNGDGISDTEVEKEIEMDKLRLKLVRRKRLSPAPPTFVPH